jgi:hypothetical protein
MQLSAALSCATIALLSASIARAGDPAPLPASEPLPPVRDARPPEPSLPPPEPLAWQKHIEVGGGFAFVEMPASTDGDKQKTGMRFAPHAGFHIDLTWPVFRYLRFTGYMVEHDHPLDLPLGSLGQMGRVTGYDGAPASVHSYTFGVRFSPTLPIGPRFRLWLTAGAGWGRLQYGKMSVTDPGQTTSFVVHERAMSIVEVPIGAGASFDIIPRWLSIRAEVTGAFVPSQIGDALEHAQGIDQNGLMRDVGPLPRLDAYLVQTLGLSLHL